MKAGNFLKLFILSLFCLNAMSASSMDNNNQQRGEYYVPIGFGLSESDAINELFEDAVNFFLNTDTIKEIEMTSLEETWGWGRLYNYTAEDENGATYSGVIRVKMREIVEREPDGKWSRKIEAVLDIRGNYLTILNESDEIILSRVAARMPQ